MAISLRDTFFFMCRKYLDVGESACGEIIFDLTDKYLLNFNLFLKEVFAILKNKRIIIGVKGFTLTERRTINMRDYSIKVAFAIKEDSTMTEEQLRDLRNDIAYDIWRMLKKQGHDCDNGDTHLGCCEIVIYID